MKLHSTIKMCFFLTVALFMTSCSDENNDAVKNSAFYSGNDLSAYAEMSSDTVTKKNNIDILKTGAWKLYKTDRTSGSTFDIPILQGTKTGKLEFSNTFEMYTLEWADGSRAAMGLRQLPISGQPNFRDLGGYKTQSGKYVKWGMVFRSGKCNALTNGDLEYLTTIPLKTIVDFRSVSERSIDPDKVPTSVRLVKELPINPGNLSSIDVMKAIELGDYKSAKQYMIDLNEALIIDFQDEYKTFFALLMDSNNTPLMFHCTAGKDRAGLGAALFLASLGVDHKTIVEDYLLTNTLTHATLENMQAQYGNTDKAKSMYYVFSVQKEYIEKAFSTIETKYGSVENFLTQQLNVDLNKIRKLYLYE